MRWPLVVGAVVMVAAVARVVANLPRKEGPSVPSALHRAYEVGSLEEARAMRVALGSVPRGAGAWLDGAFVGETPVEVEVDRDGRPVRFELELHGHRRVSWEMPADRARLAVVQRLRPVPPAEQEPVLTRPARQVVLRPGSTGRPVAASVRRPAGDTPDASLSPSAAAVLPSAGASGLPGSARLPAAEGASPAAGQPSAQLPSPRPSPGLPARPSGPGVPASAGLAATSPSTGTASSADPTAGRATRPSELAARASAPARRPRGASGPAGELTGDAGPSDAREDGVPVPIILPTLPQPSEPAAELDLEEAEPPVPFDDNPGPAYPAEAKDRGVEAVVVLRVMVDPRGEVASVTPLKGDAPFVKAAVAAVKRWRYEPATLAGKPITYRTVVKLTFRATMSSSSFQD